ncbi:MAG: hypothetical protein HUU35_20515 [Armatimonadetes bacterium]|nr:hypothetical protein [Armatimonadota bacterium]
MVVTCALLYHRTFRGKLTERALELLHRQYVLPPLGLADLEVVRETTRGIHLRCGLIRMVLPLRNAAERRFALQVKEAITAAKRRLAESEVVL